MSDDLKPCPFCTEGKSVSTYFDHEQGDKWGYAACDACGARGPEVRTNYDRADDAPWRAEAIAAWNTRTPDPRIEALTADRVKNNKDYCALMERYDALYEQLEAARHDADEAEAYAEELAKDQVDLCRQLIAAEDKLAKVVEALREIAKPKVGPDFDWSEDEVNKWRAAWYRKYGDIARTTLAEIETSDAP